MTLGKSNGPSQGERYNAGHVPQLKECRPGEDERTPFEGTEIID
jgi:hypothetical protein